MITKNQKPSTNKQADKLFATYYWEITMDQDHPENTNPNVTKITGYSKFQGEEEAKDKNHLLLRKIVMLVSRGYLKKGKQIDFYKRQGNYIDKSQNNHILTLYRNDYTLATAYASIALKSETDLIQFLTKLYDAIKNGTNVELLLPKANTNFSKDDYLNVDKHNFRNLGQLYSYCERLIKNGHPYGQVSHFTFQYLQKNAL